MSISPTAVRQLLTELFDGQRSVLTPSFEQWLTTSKAFAAFAQRYQQKIRKKIRICRDTDERYNLYCELRTAYILLQSPRYDVAYEPAGLRAGRSADFAVSLQERTLFHVEVTRLRGGQGEGDTPLENQQRSARRLTDVVCDKFGQFSPTAPTLLWMWHETPALHTVDIGALLVELKRRAEQRDPELFARHGFAKPADFIQHYQRLSAILLLNLREPTDNNPSVLWHNRDARHPLPTKVATTLRTLIAADPSLPFPGK